MSTADREHFPTMRPNNSVSASSFNSIGILAIEFAARATTDDYLDSAIAAILPLLCNTRLTYDTEYCYSNLTISLD